MNKGEIITKEEFLNIMKDGKPGSTKTEANQALMWFLDSMVKMAKLGKGVSFVSYLSFAIQHRPARDGRNPKTGETMRIEAYNQLVIRAGKKFKDACNNV